MIRRNWILTAAMVLGLVGGKATAEDKKEGDNKPKTEAIDFRKLKELMPEELTGIKRKECKGEKNKIGEISISQVQAVYQKGDEENAPKIEVQVMDYSNSDMAKGMAAAWSSVEIDKDSDDGFEKTVKVKGHPGFQTWQKEGKHGQLQLFVGQRYVMNIQTENLPAEQVIKIAEALPLDKFAALK